MKNIKGALFDLDDTLIDTNEAFKTNITDFIKKCSLETNIDEKELRACFEEIHVGAMPIISVKISRWHYVIHEMGKVYGLKARKVFVKNMYSLAKIYTFVPALLDGALELLDYCKQNNIKIGLVTHANKEWTNYKLEGVGIKNYFDHIEIADEAKHKSKENWQAALDAIKLRPDEVFLAGDNVKGDVTAGKEIGIKQTFLLPSPFRFYAAGDVPKDTTRINNLSELLNVIIKL